MIALEVRGGCAQADANSCRVHEDRAMAATQEIIRRAPGIAAQAGNPRQPNPEAVAKARAMHDDMREVLVTFQREAKDCTGPRRGGAYKGFYEDVPPAIEFPPYE